jgi:large subunit ribosomal protein L29
MKAAEMRDMDVEGLRATLRELEEELFKLRLRNVTHQLESPITIRKLRRDVARCRTILGEREREGRAGPEAGGAREAPERQAQEAARG